VLGLVGGGLALKFARDGSTAGDELDRVCAVSCTSAQARGLEDEQDLANRRAIISAVIGGVALAGGVVFVLIARSGGKQPAVSVMPEPGGASAVYAWRF
jgi:hypothetical protein